MDLSTAYGIVKAAEQLGIPDGKLRTFLAEHPDMAPQRFETRYVFWDEDVERISRAMVRIADGICIHCGKPAFGPAVPEEREVKPKNVAAEEEPADGNGNTEE